MVGERSTELIGKMLAYPAIALEASVELENEWLEHSYLQEVHIAIKQLCQEQRTPSIQSVATRVATINMNRNQHKVVEYLEGLADKAREGHASDWRQAVADTKTAYTRRQVLAATSEINQKIMQVPTSDEVISVATSSLLSALGGAGEPRAIENSQGTSMWVAAKSGEEPYIDYDWPIDSWTRRCKIRPGDIIFMGMPSGAGKSWILCDFLELMSGRYRKRSAVFGMEMSDDRIRDRLVLRGGFKRQQIDPRNFDYEVVKERVEDLISWDYKYYEGRTDIARIRSAVIRAHAENNPYHFIGIDHVHLMDHGRGEYRHGVANTMTGLREIANEYGVIILILGQLRRPPMDLKPENYRPRMNDIREASSIAEICDFVLLGKRDHTEEGHEESPYGWFYCDKMRDGMKFPSTRVILDPRTAGFIEADQGVLVR